jgi:hypothetical protein
MDAAIATLQAQGKPVTGEAVWRVVQGHRGTAQAYVKAWKEQQREASPVAPASPPTPPVSRLRSLRQQVAQLDADWEVMERAQQQLQQQRAQAHADLRNGILEVSRLMRRLRQADAQAMSPAYLMQEDAVRQREQLRAELTALVGAEDVARVRADPHSRPWWFEG